MSKPSGRLASVFARPAVLRTLALLCVFVACEVRLAQSQSLEGPGNTPVCVYQDSTFSAGAAICPQARFMLTCTQENDKLVWKVVADPALSNRCLAPTLKAAGPGRRQFARRAAAAGPAPPVAAAGAAKCFTFNYKRYCE